MASNQPPGSNHSPLLVTGAHRTGTTWVGKMLAAAPGLTYVSEPFNVLHRPGVMRAPVRHWYTYICPENEAQFLTALNETLALRYHPWLELRSLRSRKDLLRMGRDWSAFVRGRLQGHRALLKDPFAIFSIPWFIERLGCRVVVTVRHPAGFASSLKRLDWPFDVSDMLCQPLLMRDWLEPHRDELEAARTNPNDVIGQAGLLWKLVYTVAAACRERFPELCVIRHEDLSLDPTQGYQSLYTALGLAFTPQVQAAILASSSAENPAELSTKQVHGTRLDSRASLNNWKRRLSPVESERLRRLTAGVFEQFYPQWE